MANKDTVNKVKELLEGHCYGPLREAAEKWLAIADEKYDVKDKANMVMDKLNDVTDKVAEASAKFNETMDSVSDKISDKYDELSEKAGPALDKLADYAEKITDKTSDAADALSDAGEKLAESELIAQLKEGICSVGDLVDTFGAKDAAEKFGDDFTAKMNEHIKELKAKGETFCDCDACKKARSILKDFGEDLDAAADKVEDAADKAADAVEKAADKAADAVEKVIDGE